MALYIELRKLSEIDELVLYDFYPTPEISGVVEINKNTGNCRIIKRIEGDEDDHLAQHACYALMRNWNKEELPDITCWAS